MTNKLTLQIPGWPVMLVCAGILIGGCAVENSGRLPRDPSEALFTSITTFHDLPSEVSGKTFTVMGETNLIGSLENQHYLRIVEQHLATKHTPANIITNSDWLVIVVYTALAPKSTEHGLVSGGRVRLQIFDGGEYRRGRVKQVFDSQMIATGERVSMVEIFPKLMQELFRDFPGKSGVKRERFIPIP
jgi:hypothetical protein